MNELIIIRGLPGSGKSTLARKFVRLGFLHYETDMFFLDDAGNYYFDRVRLSEAHEWCQAAVRVALEEGENVVVSNTFTQTWEMQPYLDMTTNRTILTAEGKYQNLHGVPEAAIEAMKLRWERFWA